MTTDLIAVTRPVAPGRRCARCGSEYTRRVEAGLVTNDLCLTCGACWHLADGAAPIRVMPRDCAGCDFQAVCLAGLG